MATAAALMGLLSPGLPALAAPSASQLSSEISKDNDQIEQITEKYNGAEVQLKADQTLQKSLASQLLPLQLDASLAHQQISNIAQQLYMSGGNHTMEALLNSKSTVALLEALGAFNEVARGQRAIIDSDAVRVKTFSTKKATQDSLVAKDQALVASLAADKKKILANIATLTKLQDELPPPKKAAGGGGGGGGSGGGNLGGGPYTKAQIMPYACPRAPGSGKGATAVKKACALLWQPSKSPPWTMYHWAQASNSAGYDCSGFTMTAWEAAGVDLDHFTGAQWKATAGNRPTRSTLQPGDLVFYYGDHHHVAIYIGDGWIAQAEETGQPLKESPIGSPSGYGRPH